jgi:Cytochrome c554 and c-prime
VWWLWFPSLIIAAESGPARYVGAVSCASSSCHGGAGIRRDQWLQWNAKDVHRRSLATLTMARSSQIAAAAGIAEPANNVRCTVCHAPFAFVPVPQRVGELDRSEGVSCESCHAPAEPWLRAHTRTDTNRFTYADKVAVGLRDLRSLYVRANTCVACHENVDADLLKAGHPELIFELDGQSVAEPKHWREVAATKGAQAWLVGQAAALREVSWQLTRAATPDERLLARQAGLLWIVQRAAGAAGLGQLDSLEAQTDFNRALSAADEIAKSVASRVWPTTQTRDILRRLAHTATDFREGGATREVQARRAERLVLGLDRLLAASDRAVEAKLEPELKELFRLAQILPDFDPARFAGALEKFAAKL